MIGNIILGLSKSMSDLTWTMYNECSDLPQCSLFHWFLRIWDKAVSKSVRPSPSSVILRKVQSKLTCGGVGRRFEFVISLPIRGVYFASTSLFVTVPVNNHARHINTPCGTRYDGIWFSLYFKYNMRRRAALLKAATPTSTASASDGGVCFVGHWGRRPPLLTAAPITSAECPGVQGLDNQVKPGLFTSTVEWKNATQTLCGYDVMHGSYGARPVARRFALGHLCFFQVGPNKSEKFQVVGVPLLTVHVFVRDVAFMACRNIWYIIYLQVNYSKKTPQIALLNVISN